MRRSETIRTTCQRATCRAGYWRAARALVAGLFLSSCAFVDNYGPRIYQNNLTFGDANSQEALLNIVRASRHEALSFVGIGQEIGMQTETLSAGLPTFTLGPAQTAAQKQFAFAGNSLSSAANSSYQVQPLVTTNFMQGMLSPIGAKTLAMLLGTHPRPWVFYATVEGIKLIGKAGTRDLVYYFTNDPADDQYDGVATNEKCRDLVTNDTYFDAPIYSDDNACNFSKFARAMQEALDYGLSSEFLLPDSSDKGGGSDGSKNQCCCCGKPSPAPTKPPTKPSTAPQIATTKTGAGTNASADAPQPASPSVNATANTSAIGHICWDPNLALPRNRSDVLQMHNICGNINKANPTLTLGSFTFRHSVQFSSIQFVFRSPYGVYKYLGQLLREGSVARIHFANLRGFEQRELNSGLFLNITERASPDCLVTAFYNGESFCVPRKGSNSTAVLLDILGQLKNLSVSPTDLNAAFAVRLAN